MYPDLSFQCVDFDEVVEARPYAEAGRLGAVERGAMLLDQFLGEAGELSWTDCTEDVNCEQGTAVSPDGVVVLVEHSWTGGETWKVMAEAPEGLRAWTKLTIQWVHLEAVDLESVVWVASWAGSIGEGWPADQEQVAGMWEEQTSRLTGGAVTSVTEAWNDGGCVWLSSYRERVVNGIETPISWYIQVNDNIARVSTRGGVTRGRVNTGAWVNINPTTWETPQTPG